MKKQLSIYYVLLVTLFLLPIAKTNAQISYSEDFEVLADIEWTDGDGYFWLDDEEACNGSSVVGNLYYYNPVAGTSVSGSIGTSNGDPAIISYSYKLVDYYTLEGYANSPAWGEFTLEYGPSATGPWTEIETITPSNHIVSDDCAVRTIEFTPPAGEVFLRLIAQVNAAGFTDALLYFDDVVVTQESCSGTPAAAEAEAAEDEICLNEPAELSLSPGYNATGISYQWQTSADGITYEDVATGGGNDSYSALQAQDTWYRAVITCDSSGESTTSEAVLVESTGEFCYCDVEFEFGVEPITLVEFAGISNATSAEVDGTPEMEDFTSLEPGQVVLGETYTATFEGNTNGLYENTFMVFIDFNQNGSFDDEDESFEMGYLTDSDGEDGQQVTGDITIPADAVTGTTRMRVYKNYYDDLFGTPYPDGPCGDTNGGFGQVEDYLINISCATPAPTAMAEQDYCGVTTADMLMADGENILWYAEEVGGEPLTGELTTGVYYASQTVNGCESTERAEVSVNVTVVTIPEIEETLTFCNEADGEDINEEFEGDIIWYADETGGEPLGPDDELENGMVYYGAAFEGDCESERVPVTVIINEVAAPTGESMQVFEFDQLTVVYLNDIEIEAQGTVTWYANEEDAEDGENALSGDTTVDSGATYYATQTIDGCESEPFAVTVEVILFNKDFDAASFTYYPNPVKDALTLTYGGVISNVEVYNLVGQQVIVQPVGSNEAVLDMSQLASGTYMVKVYSAESSTVIKVIKQ